MKHPRRTAGESRGRGDLDAGAPLQHEGEFPVISAAGFDYVCGPGSRLEVRGRGAVAVDVHTRAEGGGFHLGGKAKCSWSL